MTTQSKKTEQKWPDGFVLQTPKWIELGEERERHGLEAATTTTRTAGQTVSLEDGRQIHHRASEPT